MWARVEARASCARPGVSLGPGDQAQLPGVTLGLGLGPGRSSPHVPLYGASKTGAETTEKSRD
jgi:hypothetical protein